MAFFVTFGYLYLIFFGLFCYSLLCSVFIFLAFLVILVIIGHFGYILFGYFFRGLLLLAILFVFFFSYL